MATTPALIEAFLNEVTRTHDPMAKIVKKTDSKFMKVLAVLLRPFNRHFMDRYITTIGSTIYIPDGFFDNFNEVEALDVIAHETQHMIDNRRMGFFFQLLYLSPQILALFALLAFGAFWNLWMLLWLIALVFAAPLPSPGRYWAELHGYRTSIVFARKVYMHKEEQMIGIYNWVEEQLAGPWYYFAWPFRKCIENDLRNEGFMKEPRYVELIKFLEDHEISPR